MRTALHFFSPFLLLENKIGMARCEPQPRDTICGFARLRIGVGRGRAKFAPTHQQVHCCTKEMHGRIYFGMPRRGHCRSVTHVLALPPRRSFHSTRAAFSLRLNCFHCDSFARAAVKYRHWHILSKTVSMVAMESGTAYTHIYIFYLIEIENDNGITLHVMYNKHALC